MKPSKEIHDEAVDCLTALSYIEHREFLDGVKGHKLGFTPPILKIKKLLNTIIKQYEAQ